LSNTSATFLQAGREFQTSSDKKMFWGHIDYYLIGEEAAKEGVAKYIDFLSRDNEIRGNSKVYIIKGATAKEFIEKTGAEETFMPDRLKAIEENAKLVTGAQDLELYEFLVWLNNKYSSAVAPVLCLKPKENNQGEEQGDKQGDEQKDKGQHSMDFDLGGYAFFKNLKLVDIMGKEMTRGENFLLNRVTSGAIEVKDPEGNMVGLEIIDNSTKISPKFEKNELKEVNIKVKLSSNVGEVHSTSDIITKNILDFLANEQSNIIKNEIERVIAYAQGNNTDFVDIANVIESKYPTKWVKYKERWDEIFPDLLINVEVRSRINRTYDIREPSGVFEEEHK
jgi:spore germination protein KC